MTDSTKPVKLSKREWAELEAKYKTGDYTAKELAHAYGVSAGTVTAYLHKNRIKKGEDANKLVEEARKAVADDEAKVASETYKKIQETKEEHYRYAKAVAGLTYNLIATAVREKQSFGAINDDLKSMKEASTIFAQTQKARWDILGVDKFEDLEEDLPILMVEDFTDQEIKEIQRRQSHTMFSDDVDEKIAEAAEKALEDLDDLLDI